MAMEVKSLSLPSVNGTARKIVVCLMVKNQECLCPMAEAHGHLSSDREQVHPCSTFLFCVQTWIGPCLSAPMRVFFTQSTDWEAISSRNAHADTMFYQLSGHLQAQSSWHIKSVVTDSQEIKILVLPPRLDGLGTFLSSPWDVSLDGAEEVDQVAITAQDMSVPSPPLASWRHHAFILPDTLHMVAVP